MSGSIVASRLASIVLPAPGGASSTATGRVSAQGQGGGHAGHNGLRSLHANVGDAYGRVRMGVAGDTYNTAVSLARAGLPVSYLTVLGQDALSGRILDAMTAEGIDTADIPRHAERLPGIYAIELDDAGMAKITSMPWSGRRG